MPIDTSSPTRREWKYRVPRELARELIDTIRSRAEPDPHCIPCEGGAYSVRSVYYDTPLLRFYHEKKDGVKVRRKLRVRNYGDDICFLEIKRKMDGQGLKERVSLNRSQLLGALDGVDPTTLMVGRTDGEQRTLERFRFNMRSLGLVPTVLIAYRRHAWWERQESSLRITLDSELRSRADPGPNALFEESGLEGFDDSSVLELKFEGRWPAWIAKLVSDFHLRREPFSKYCEGLDRWLVPSGAGPDGASRDVLHA